MKTKESIVTNTKMVQIVRNRPRSDLVLFSGLTQLDKYTQGFRAGELYVITGYTKAGKSLFCKTLTRGFYDQGEFPLYFQYEEEVEQFLKSFPNMSRDLIFYLPDEIKYNDIEWLLTMIQQGIEKFGVKAVIIDHLHFLMDSRKLKTNASLFIGDFVRDIKKFALDHRIVVFLVCHTRKQDTKGTDDYSVGAVRDSGMIPALADSTLFIHREVEDTGITRVEQSFIKVCNHRRTGAWNVVIPTIKSGDYLKEV